MRAYAMLLAASVAAALALPAAATADEYLAANDPCLGDPPPAPYIDRALVPETHHDTVDCAFAGGYLVGQEVAGQRLLLPTQPTSRAQMASIVTQALEHAGYDLPDDAPDAFRDDDGSVHEGNIDALAATGIVVGTSATTFSPDKPVRRDQMASFLVQAAGFTLGDTGFEPVEDAPFTDVAADNPHRDNITVAATILGLAMGEESRRYDPHGTTRRDQIATFGARLVDLVLLDTSQPASDPESGPVVGGP